MNPNPSSHDPSAPSDTWRRRLLALTLLAAGGAALLLALVLRPEGDAAAATSAPNAVPTTSRWMTQTVETGDLQRAVTATGTLNAVNLVQVGSQVSGTIKALHVDYNSPVRRGQLLAEIDTAALDADLASASAARDSAQAGVTLARSQLERERWLLDQGLISQSQYDQTRQQHDSAQAQLRQQEAALARARNARSHAEIRSPVAGTVVSRDIAVGQTLQASFAAPTLFRIAEDLREMQIEASVAEADIGLVQPGQTVTYTVDAWPDETFEGRVVQVRNNYAVQQNVVTYTVVIRTRNEALLLRPGMTAYLRIEAGRRQAVLRLPNAALRYQPSAAAVGNAAATGATGAAGTAVPRSVSTVWLLAPGAAAPQAVRVRTGLSDGRWTELVEVREPAGLALKAGDVLVIGEPPKADGFAPPKLL
ncbi:efflux RND transporter periplasmic adaptor subunit [Leptothrix sp. BB-4]